MSKIVSFIRWLAVLGASLILASCGGGGDDADNQAVPIGAKVCELQDFMPSSHPTPDFGNIIRSDGDGFALSISLVDGGTRYAISNWQPFYALVGTWPGQSPYGLVEGTLTVPTDKSTVLYYSNYLGTLNGRHVEGETREWILVGPDTEDRVTPEDVQGIKLPSHGGAWPASPHMMSAPRLTQLDQHLFRVQEGRYQEADWSRIPNATVEFEVFTDSETEKGLEYRHCEVRGLTDPANVIAVTGGRHGKTYWVRAITYAPLDGGIRAYSQDVYAKFVY